MPGAIVSRKRVIVTGKADPSVVEAIQTLQDQVQALTSHAMQTRAAKYLTRTQADALYGPGLMQKALSANGSHPLNCSNLLGVLAQKQKT